MTSVSNHTDDRELQATKEKLLLIVSNMVSDGQMSRDELFSALPKRKGRAVPANPKFVFPSSGIECEIRRLGPFTLDAINRQMRQEIKPPEVPKVIVNYGTDEQPDFKSEENPASEEYRQALADYEKKIEEKGALRMIDIIIENAVIIDVDLDEVNAMRKFLKQLGVTEEELNEESDHSIYVKHVCIKSTDDLSKLQEFVVGQNVPSEALVKAHEDSFRSDVQGQTDREMSNAIVGNEV